MKTNILLILLNLIFINSYGQCGQGMSIKLETQTDIDNFINNYCIEYEGSLQIIDNNDGQDDIVSLTSLLSLRKIEGVFIISLNSNLGTLDGLDSIVHVGSLTISDNPLIVNLEGLNSLYSIFGDLFINGNDNLENLDALITLSEIENSGGYLTISRNKNLTSISGLMSLTSYISGIRILENEKLENLNGLDNLLILVNIGNPLAKDVEIYKNDSLKYCGVESVCVALNTPEVKYEIYSNKENCNSKTEVISTCVTSTNDNDQIRFILYPNPIYNEAYINSLFRMEIKISNSQGHLIKRIQIEKGKNRVDLTSLKQGVYFLHNQWGDTKKLIKL